MKLKDLTQVLLSSTIHLMIEVKHGNVKHREIIYYDTGYKSERLERFKDYKVTLVHAWEYDELRIFITKGE